MKVLYNVKDEPLGVENVKTEPEMMEPEPPGV